MNLDFTNQELYDNGINLDIVIVKPGYEDIDKIKKLFDVSFDGGERPKITNLLRDDDKLEFYAFYNDGDFIGASVWVNIMKKIMYGLWLAVNPEFRGHGYGTQIVKFAKLLARKRGKVYMGTIQDPNEKSDNQEYRKFRWNFYKKLGFHLTNYGYTDGKENLKMITLNGRVGKNISNKAVEEAFKYYNNTLNETFNNEIQAKEDNLNDAIDDLAYIQFEDPEVERICHEQLHVYTYADAKKIIELNAESGFYRSEIKSFNELKYFINLKKIEKYTFNYCNSLQQINIPNGVTEIGSCAFMGCKSLQQINIPNGVTKIGPDAFGGCKSLQQINIPNGVTKIKDFTFYKCNSLQQINIPNGVTEIGSGAFYNCESLQIIDISGITSITKLKNSAFENCSNLKTIYVSPILYKKFYKYKNSKKYQKYLNIFDKFKIKELHETFNNEIQAQEDNLNDAIDDLSYIQFKDPEVERICHEQLHVYTYEDAKKITELNARSGFYISEIKSFNELKYFINLKKIEKSTFNYCKSLQQINIPNGVTEIGFGAFMGCKSLQQINIPNSVTEIDSDAFDECKSLQQINIPNGITKIKDYTFYNCDSLQQINIPNGVTEIGSGAFMGCKSLQQINIPNSVTEIGPNAFMSCKSLQQINIPNGVTEIGSGTFMGCKSLQQINIPNVTEIGPEALLNCNSLQIIDISGITSITKLKSLAFENCSKLKTIYISPILYEKIKSKIKIKSSKKYQKYLNIFDKFKIKELQETFNNEIQAQEDNINDAINDLSYIQFEDPEVEKICHEKLHVYTYADAKKITNIPVMCFYSSKIESFDELKYFTNLKEIGIDAFLGCDKLKSIILPDSITTIKGGVFCCCDSLEYIKLPKNLQNIAPDLFSGSNIKQIIIPNKVTTIGDRAFQCCKYLQQIIIPNSVGAIGDSAFIVCESLQQITIPGNIRYIGNDAFDRCKNLEAIYVSKENYEKFKNSGFGTLLKIKNDSNLINETFNNEIQAQEDDINDAINDLSYIQFEDPEVERICHEQLHVYTYEDAKKVTNLCNFGRTIKIKYFNELKYFTNLKKINDHAFATCSQLKQITLPDSITEIDNAAFFNCKSLQHINIPNKVTKIGYAAFYQCESLQQINTPNSVTEIGPNAFMSCKSLQQINIPNGVTEIGSGTFMGCKSLQQINIPNVTEIGPEALLNCNSLQIIDISGITSITKLKSLAFENCSKLKTIYISPILYEKIKSKIKIKSSKKYQKYLNIFDKFKIKELQETFNNEIQAQEDNINDAINDLSYIQFEDPEVEKICHEKLHVYTYADAKKITNIPVMCFYSSKIESFDELKYFTNLKEIRTDAFSGCKSLQQINIPNSVTEIKDYTFCNCNSLQQINIPNGVTEIKDYTFCNCKSLQQINIPNSVTEIGNAAFFNCNSLQQINIPNGVTEIGSGAFMGCNSLQQISIPNSVTEIKDYTFCNCNSLQQINIPNVTEIGPDAFNDCESLQTINISNVKDLKDKVFVGCNNLKTIYVSPILYKKFYKYGSEIYKDIFNKVKIKSNSMNETFNNDIQAQNDDINDAIENIGIMSKNIFLSELNKLIDKNGIYVYGGEVPPHKTNPGSYSIFNRYNGNTLYSFASMDNNDPCKIVLIINFNKNGFSLAGWNEFDGIFTDSYRHVPYYSKYIKIINQLANDIIATPNYTDKIINSYKAIFGNQYYQEFDIIEDDEFMW